jgi:hypothetical protein
MTDGRLRWAQSLEAAWRHLAQPQQMQRSEEGRADAQD